MNIREEKFTCIRDNLAIRGMYYVPDGGNVYPVAVVSHGFHDNINGTMRYAKALSENGYAAFCFDFCGGTVKEHCTSDGDTDKMTVFTEVEDLKAVISYAFSLPFTCKENLLLMGCSQGGFVSALTAAQLKSSVEKLILFYPALCIPDDARNGRMISAHFDPESIPDTFYCGDMLLGRCYPEAVNKIDPYKEIVAYSGKVLIVHGTADTLVATSYSLKAMDEYTKVCTQKPQLLLIENAPHGFYDDYDTQAINKIKEFSKL